ncbi:unnamed protein product, partial [Medioppia subpectinata]
MKFLIALMCGLVCIVSADYSKEDYKAVATSRDFTGSVVVVTGSSSGIGEGIVKLFSILGANVVVTGRKAQDVQRVAKEVQELSPLKLKPLEVVGDLTKTSDINNLIDSTVKTFGKIDVLVNNAGIYPETNITQSDLLSVWDQVFAVDLRAVVELIHRSVPHLEKTNGTIIDISSVLSLAPVCITTRPGEGIVKLFSILGANVVVTGRKAQDVQRVSKEVQELSPLKLKPLEVVGDLTKTSDINNLIDSTVKTFGKIDVLVNNAGIYPETNITQPDLLSVWDQVFAVDLRAVVELIHRSVPHLEKTNGTIIDISSVLSLAPTKTMLAYAPAKAGLDMLTKILALELGPKGIRVNTVNPGTIQNRDILTPIEKLSAKYTPLGRVGQPLDIARAVAFLASTDAHFITGANVVVDGGFLSALMCGLVCIVSADYPIEDYKAVAKSRDFTGSVVVVTGSSSGIGEGIVKLFSILGANVVVTGRTAQDVQRVAKEVQELSPLKLKPLEVVGDLTKTSDVNNLIDSTVKTFSKIDVLVNNAGIYPQTNITQTDLLSVWDQIFAVDLRAVVELIHRSVPHLEKTNGTIIDISSVASLA